MKLRASAALSMAVFLSLCRSEANQIDGLGPTKLTLTKNDELARNLEAPAKSIRQDKTNVDFIAKVVPGQFQSKMNNQIGDFSSIAKSHRLSRRLEAFMHKKDGHHDQSYRSVSPFADVVGPTQGQNDLNKGTVSDHHRYLQIEGPVCGEIEDGSLICAMENYPINGFTTVFLGCQEGSTLADCQGCVLVEEDDIGELVENDRECNSCAICTDDISFDCTNIDPQEPCASRDCNGNCTNTPSTSIMCTDADDGSLQCAIDDIPQPGFVTLFEGCTETDGSVNVYQCGKCAIGFEDSIEEIDENDPACTACNTCGDRLSFNCANIVPNEVCAVQDCNGTCLGSTSALPTASPSSNPAIQPTPVPSTVAPQAQPNVTPQVQPTVAPTEAPTAGGAPLPTASPSSNPSIQSTSVPSTVALQAQPTGAPQVQPTVAPTETPTAGGAPPSAAVMPKGAPITISTFVFAVFCFF